MSAPSLPTSSSSAPIAPARAQTAKPRKFKSMQAYLKHKRGEGSPPPSPSPSPPPPPPPSYSSAPISSTSPTPSRAASRVSSGGTTATHPPKSGPSFDPAPSGPTILPNGFAYHPSASTSAIMLPNGLAYHPSRSIAAIEVETRAAVAVASAEARRRDRSIMKSADAAALFEERMALHRERKELEAHRQEIEQREAALLSARRDLKRRRRELCDDEAADIAIIQDQGDACARQVRKVMRASKRADAPSTSAAAALDDDDDELSNDEEDERRAKLIRAVKQEYEETGVPPPVLFDARDMRDIERYDGPDNENVDPEGDAYKILGKRNVEEDAGVASMDVDEGPSRQPLALDRAPSTRAIDPDARYSPPRRVEPPSHLQGLTGMEKGVHFELYRDQDPTRESKYLRAIVEHIRPPLPVKPKPQVRDPTVVLDNCNIPRTVFQVGKRSLTDGKFLYRVLGFTESERFMVASPNAAFLPHVPDPDVVQRIRMRADRRFGSEDITLVPTYFLPNYAPHLACIPARPLSIHHPSQIMWIEPEKLIEKLSDKLRDDHNAYVLTAPAADQFHRVILPVCKRAGRYLDLCAQAGKMPIVWTRGLKIALGHIFGYLKHIPAPRERALLMVRELQRLWLELKGMVNFVYDIQPILTGTVDQPEVVTTQWYIGAATCDPRDVLGLQRAGVPVWHVMEFDFAAREVLLSKHGRGRPAARQLVKMYTPEQMAETGRHPGNLPYIFEGLPTDPSRLKQIHRYTNLALSISPAYQDDLAQVAGRDPYAHPAISNRVYGTSRLRPLEYLQAGGEGSGGERRRIPPEEVKRDMPVVDLQQVDTAFEDGDAPPAGAFDFVEDHNPFAEDDSAPMNSDMSCSTTRESTASKTLASDVPACAAASTSSPASPSTSSTTSAGAAASKAAASTSVSPIASSTAPPPPPKSMPGPSGDVQWVQSEGGGIFKATGAIYRPVGVHGVPRLRDLSRHHRSDLPIMPRVWRDARDEVQDNWRHDGAEKGDRFRTFPLPDVIVGSTSEAKIARFYQVWVTLEGAAIENARKVPRDPQVFQRHSAGMTWVQPEGQAWVARREDLVRVEESSATPDISNEPCLAASAQEWKDVLNAHTTFRAVGENRQAFLMAKVREIFGATINFDKVLASLSQPYIALGEVCTSARPPSREIARGILWRLQELIFRKDLTDLDRRLRLIFITRAEEHQRLRMVFARETYGADILSIYGEGERDQGLVAQDWMERYPYVVALADLMLDWDEPLPRRVRDVLRTPRLSQREFEWMEKKVIQHYAAMLFAHFHRKVVGPARRSVATSKLRC